MSVQAWTPASCISSEALLFKVVIETAIRATASSPATPPLMAVLTIPVPRGLVRISLSPTSEPLLAMILEG
ncbi:hypothetical protein ES703_54121 [subsurface metagenome]